MFLYLDSALNKFFIVKLCSVQAVRQIEAWRLADFESGQF